RRARVPDGPAGGRQRAGVSAFLRRDGRAVPRGGTGRPTTAGPAGSAPLSEGPCTVSCMTRTRVRHRCEACGAEQPKWLGRCPDCGEWGSVIEQPGATTDPARGRVASAPVALADVDPLGAPLRASGVSELDRVLGGGLIAGSVTLLAGEPGIGKS